ncbi:MAG: hypothetical protein Q9M41_05415 [Paracoccaceae bacterium]|nr:hypothetical protein [Paracoccaceae bacterium]
MQEATDHPEPKVKWSWRNADLGWVSIGPLCAALVWMDNRYPGGGYSGHDMIAAVMTAALTGIGGTRAAFVAVFAQDRKRLLVRLCFGLYNAIFFSLFLQLGFPETGVRASLESFLAFVGIFGLLQAAFAVNAPSEIRALFEQQTIFDRDDVVARLGRIWPFATLAVYLGLMIVTGSPLVAGLACASMLCFSPRIRRFRGTHSWQQRARVVEGARLITVITLIAANISASVG